MSLITFEKAELIAEEIISNYSTSIGIPLMVLKPNIKSTSDGWIFFYNTVEYIETGSISTALAGNGPIFISSSGAIHDLPSNLTWEEGISRISKSISN